MVETRIGTDRRKGRSRFSVAAGALVGKLKH